MEHLKSPLNRAFLKQIVYGIPPIWLNKLVSHFLSTISNKVST